MFLGLLQQQAAIDSSNAVIKRNSDLFLKLDPFGIGMTVIGYVVVFVALLLLYLLFFNPVSYTHLRAHETVLDFVCLLLLEKKKYILLHTM